MNQNSRLDKIYKNKDKKKYLMLCFFCGILFMILPGINHSSDDAGEREAAVETFSVEREEKRLEAVLSSIHGVGKCKVLLSVRDGTQKILAENEGDTVVLSSGGTQSTVTVQEVFPHFQGAVIVSGGSSDAHVRYDILSAVMAYTGLEANKITICPIEE